VLDVFTAAASAHPALIAAGIFGILLLCGFGLPLPEDIVLAFTGYVVYLGILPLWFGIFVGLAGVLIGDSTLFWLGQRFGARVMELRFIRRFLPPARLQRIQRLYRKYGSRMLFMARFTPVMRAGVFLFAGWAGVPYLRFVLTDGSAALLSVPAIVTVTYLLGAQIDRAIHAIRGVEHWILVGIALIVAWHIVHGALVRRRERRRLVGPELQHAAPVQPDETLPKKQRRSRSEAHGEQSYPGD
jgi:membrane protein DedA with SNARE-associated domain